MEREMSNRGITTIPAGLRHGPITPPAWTEVGKCVGEWELFEAEPNTVEAGRAIAMCNTCPVMHMCGASAKKRGEDYGIWGGVHHEAGPVTLCRAGLHDMSVAAVSRPIRGDQSRTNRTLCGPCETQKQKDRRARNKELTVVKAAA